MALQKPTRREDVMCREIGGEGILYNPETKYMHILNKTAFALWKLCDGKHDSLQITSEITSRFEVAENDDVLVDINKILDELKKLRLLEWRR